MSLKRPYRIRYRHITHNINGTAAQSSAQLCRLQLRQCCGWLWQGASSSFEACRNVYMCVCMPQRLAGVTKAGFVGQLEGPPLAPPHHICTQSMPMALCFALLLLFVHCAVFLCVLPHFHLRFSPSDNMLYGKVAIRLPSI